MKQLVNLATPKTLYAEITRLSKTHKLQIGLGFTGGFIVLLAVVGFIKAGFSVERFATGNMYFELVMFIMGLTLLYVVPFIDNRNLRRSNTRLRSTHKVMLRTEKMLRRHNEELELGRLQLADMAHKDRLTGLKNRRQFDVLFNKYFQAAECGVEEFALILIDLNDFKPINDTHGHAAGDALLREVGTRLRECSRGKRADVFRLGGDEFAILLKIEQQTHLARFEKIVAKTIAQPFPLADLSVSITAAVGACRYKDQPTAQDVFVQADRNLYAAKATKASALLNENHQKTASVG